MNALELRSGLEALELSQLEAARLLSVNSRTLTRWLDGSVPIPGPVKQVLHAWSRLQRLGVPWKPDGVEIGDFDETKIAEQIARYRQHAIELDSVLKRVKARGGPMAPWRVDLPKRRATLGALEVSFYPLANGGFSPQLYRRKDREPDLQRDWVLLEDAFACIASEIAKAGTGWMN